MTHDTDHPLARLRARVDRYQDHGDSWAVLDPEALVEADAAWRASTEEGPDATMVVNPYAVYVLALFHWCRCLALPEGQDEDDLQQALNLFAPLMELMPQAVPRAARDMLGLPAEDPEALLAEVRRRVDLYRDHGDTSGLADDQSPDIAMRLQLAAEGSDGTPFPAAHAIAMFRWYRHLVMSDEADTAAGLDEAMRFFRWLDTVDPDGLPDELWPLSEADPAVARTAHRAMASVSWISDLRTADRTIASLRRAIDGLPRDHASRGPLMAHLAVAHQLRFTHGGDAADLDLAVDWGRRGHAALPTDHPDWHRHTSHLANALLLRYQMTDVRETADLEAAVALSEEAVRRIPSGHKHRGELVANLAAALGLRFEHAMDPADLDRAISLGRETLSEQRIAERHGALHNLAHTLRLRFELAGDADDLEEALRYATEAVAEAEMRAPEALADLQGELAWLLWLTYQRSEDLADLDAALDACRSAAADTAPTHSMHVSRAIRVWVFASERHRRTDAQEDMDAAVEAGRVAVSLADRLGPATGNLSRADLLRGFALLLAIRFDSTGDLDALDEAIATLRVALAQERRPDILKNLSTDLRSRARLAGARDDWDEAVETGRAAVAAAPDGHPERPDCLSQLCATLRERYEAYGEPTDLEEAVAVGLAAVEPADPPGSPDLPDAVALSHLAGALTLRYQRTGNSADLDDAVSHGRLAVEAGDPDKSGYAGALANLASALGTRYEQRGAAVDLDEAIALGQGAADLTPSDSPMLGGRLMNVSLALRARYERTGTREDLDRAVDAAQASVDATPAGHVQLGAHLTALAHALHARYERDNHRTDADRSVEIGTAAVEATWPGHPRRALYLNNLGIFHVTRAEEDLDRAATEADLRKAIGLYRQGLDIAADDSPERFGLLLNLGNALRQRYELTGRRTDAMDAIAGWRQVADHPAAAAWPRLAAARQWGEIAARLGVENESVLKACATAVAQLPLLAWHGLGRGDRERLLTQTRGLAADSAAAALAAGRPDRALELLEQGRGVIWSQILDVRTDLAELHAIAPHLATELDRIRDELDRPAEPLLGEPVPVPADHRMRLADRWDALVEQVRALPGFASFLRPLPASTLCEAVGAGPVVVVNVSNLRCDALLVTADGVRAVPLPGLNAGEVVDRADAYLSALMRFASGHRGLAERVGLELAVDELLRWLWDTVAAPVLDALGLLGPLDASGVRPRVWWYPTGALTLLPLHAAGHHQECAGRTVLDRVVSSYAPTLKVLSRSRGEASTEAQAGAQNGDGRLLLVALADTPGMPSLPNVHAERSALTSLLPGRCTELDGSGATRQAVGDALPEHAWVHFSCHGGQDLAEPSKGGVHLHDGMLTVEELTSARHAQGEMAFLSACQTALGGLRNLDEAITLTSALQHAGWRHVVGTLWSVWDAAAARISESAYRQMVRDGLVDVHDVARALHRATLAMRDDLPQRPSLWAPFVHVGP